MRGTCTVTAASPSMLAAGKLDERGQGIATLPRSKVASAGRAVAISLAWNYTSREAG